MYWFSKSTNKRYYCKILGLQECNDLCFTMGEVYDTYDWGVEPEEDWYTILNDRAQKIRDSYNYVRLWYSGGADSQTILNVFLRNNIHLDEIGVWRQAPFNNFTGPGSEEANEVAIPQLKEIEKLIPKTKIKIYDIGYNEYVNYFKNHFSLEKTNVMDFRIAYASTIHNIIPGINDYENICNITGLEKPTIGIDEKGVYWYFVDSTILDHITDPNSGDYQAPFFMDPMVHSKQCHIVKNYILKTPGSQAVPLVTANKVCRDPLYINFSYGKGNRSVLSPKTQLTVNATRRSAAKHLVSDWHKILDNCSLDKKYFNDGNVLGLLVGMLSEKYYVHLFA